MYLYIMDLRRIIQDAVNKHHRSGQSCLNRVTIEINQNLAGWEGIYLPDPNNPRPGQLAPYDIVLREIVNKENVDILDKYPNGYKHYLEDLVFSFELITVED